MKIVYNLPNTRQHEFHTHASVPGLWHDVIVGGDRYVVARVTWVENVELPPYVVIDLKNREPEQRRLRPLQPLAESHGEDAMEKMKARHSAAMNEVQVLCETLKAKDTRIEGLVAKVSAMEEWLGLSKSK